MLPQDPCRPGVGRTPRPAVELAPRACLLLSGSVSQYGRWAGGLDGMKRALPRPGSRPCQRLALGTEIDLVVDPWAGCFGGAVSVGATGSRARTNGVTLTVSLSA